MSFRRQLQGQDASDINGDHPSPRGSGLPRPNDGSYVYSNQYYGSSYGQYNEDDEVNVAGQQSPSIGYGYDQRQVIKSTRSNTAQLEKECLESLQNSLVMTAETEQIANSTAHKLDEQTDTIHRIRHTTEAISGNLETSQYLLTGMKSWWSSVWQMFTSPPDPGQVHTKAEKERAKRLPPSDPQPQKRSRNEGSMTQSRTPGVRPAGGSTEGYSEFEETMNRDLGTLSEMLGSIHSRAQEMNSTIGYQTEVLDEVTTNVETNSATMKDQRSQMNRLMGRKD